MFVCLDQATKARYLQEHREEADHLLKAGRWNEAHQVVVTHLASDAIVNGEKLSCIVYVFEKFMKA